MKKYWNIIKPYLTRFGHFIWPVIKYALLILGIFIILVLLLLIGAYRNLKQAADAGTAGKTALTAAVAAAQKQDWTSALADSGQAHDDFTSALNSLDQARSNWAIKYVAPVKSQVDDLEYLLKTGEILSRSLQTTLPIIQELDRIRSGAASHNFIDLSAADKINFLKLIYESEPELNGLKANLDLAILNLDKIHRISILWPVYNQISNIKTELVQASSLMAKTDTLVKLLPALAGYPNASHFLVILQNNDELRPSGGFIGVYGSLTAQNGSITAFQSDDSYHLDMPASLSKWNLQPPTPLAKYLKVDRWYLRDANWSPDWPTSAQQIETIYNGENQMLAGKVASTTPFTGILAINPDLVADLIKLVGPITVKNVTYTADNFQPLLQYNVEVGYKDQNISFWQRKEIINELVAQLKDRLYHLPASSWEQLLNVISDNIDHKNIQIYFPNSDWEGLVRTLGASGEVKNPTSDYLMVVDANLGSFKTDAVVKKNITYTLTQNNSGLQAAVKLNYRHEGGFDWRTTRYRTYTRIYAPLGSHFVSLDGLDQSTADFSSTDDTKLNKTVFGFFVTIEPGTTQELTLNYTLPSAINSQLQNKQYQLLVQKQSGQRVDSLQVIVNRANKKPLNWQTKLEDDQLFQVNQ